MGKSKDLKKRRAASFIIAGFALAGVTPSTGWAATMYAAVTGSNSNACTLASAPCLTISGALAKAVSAGGFPRVIVLGPGIFLESVSVTSTSGAEIVGDGNGFTGIAPPSGGVGVSVAVGTASMRISNLQFLGNSGAAAAGVKILTAGKMDFQNVEFHGFATAGIDSEVSTTPYPAMTIANSLLADGGCLRAHPVGSANLSVLVENTRLHNCNLAVLADSSGTASAGSVSVILRNSSIEAATTGLEVNSGAGGQAMGTLDHSIVENATTGVLANAANSYVFLNESTITNTHTAVTNKSASVTTFGNNNISWNAVNNVGTLSKNGLQ